MGLRSAKVERVEVRECANRSKCLVWGRCLVLQFWSLHLRFKFFWAALERYAKTELVGILRYIVSRR